MCLERNMQVYMDNWSKTEKAVARKAFDSAYQKECASILMETRKRLACISDPEDVWEINDYLWDQRKQINDKYDYRYSVLLDVLTRLICEGWVSLDALDGLDEEKRGYIKWFLSFRETCAEENANGDA